MIDKTTIGFELPSLTFNILLEAQESLKEIESLKDRSFLINSEYVKALGIFRSND